VLEAGLFTGLDLDVLDLLRGLDDVGGDLRGDHVDLAVLDGLHLRHRVLVPADRQGVVDALVLTLVLGVLLEGHVLVLFEVLDHVGAAGEHQVGVVGHRGEVEAGVPELRDLHERGLVLVLDGLDQGVLGLLRVGDAEGLLGHDVRRQVDAHVVGPVSEGLGVRHGQGLAVVADLRRLLDQAQAVGGGVEVDLALGVLGQSGRLVGLDLVGGDGVQVAAAGRPVEEHVGGVDRRAVGPLGVVGDGVLHRQRVVAGLLVGAERLVGLQLALRVDEPELARGEVLGVGVGDVVAVRGVLVVRVERLVPTQGERGLLVAAALVVVLRRGAGGSRQAQRGDHRHGGEHSLGSHVSPPRCDPSRTDESTYNQSGVRLNTMTLGTSALEGESETVGQA
jgi:hypothetical protein